MHRKGEPWILMHAHTFGGQFEFNFVGQPTWWAVLTEECFFSPPPPSQIFHITSLVFIPSLIITLSISILFLQTKQTQRHRKSKASFNEASWCLDNLQYGDHYSSGYAHQKSNASYDTDHGCGNAPCIAPCTTHTALTLSGSFICGVGGGLGLCWSSGWISCSNNHWKGFGTKSGMPAQVGEGWSLIIAVPNFFSTKEPFHPWLIWNSHFRETRGGGGF